VVLVSCPTLRLWGRIADCGLLQPARTCCKCARCCREVACCAIFHYCDVYIGLLSGLFLGWPRDNPCGFVQTRQILEPCPPWLACLVASVHVVLTVYEFYRPVWVDVSQVKPFPLRPRLQYSDVTVTLRLSFHGLE